MNRRNRKGAAAVEFALTAPVLFLLLFGAYELSRGNLLRHTCEGACYEGARVGIVPGATSQDVVDATNRILATAGITGADITIQPSNLATPTRTVTVTVEADYGENSVIPARFLGGALIRRECELLREVRD